MDINAILAQIDAEINNCNSPESLEQFRLKYLGRKGVLAQLTGTIPGIAKEERPVFGQQVNSLKNKILLLIEEKQKVISVSSKQQKPGLWDIGMPGIAQELGQLHPLTQVTDEICAIFKRMGFSVVEGPEIESEYNNFTGLNIPLEHPSREAFDTFYLKNYPKMLLRSHTSPVQVRAMQNHKPPLAIIVPGRVYRPDAVDASHSFMFHQVEGFMVDEGIKFSDLKGILEVFVKAFFSATNRGGSAKNFGGGKNIKMRFRPHFFPFTEPSAEVDISCIICNGKGWLVEPPAAATSLPPRGPKGFTGCSVCGRKGWLEILGSGMIHPNVFKHVNIDAEKYTGFAFGMGVERIAMLKYGINDIRLFFENDLRFLRQF